MAVKILIKRKVPPNKAAELNHLINQLRVLSTVQPGYISGETLKRIDQSDESLVISKWQTENAWKKWLHSAEREKIQHKIDELLVEKTEYEMYCYE
jgi:heme-degrading monooxygenase HmoA